MATEKEKLVFNTKDIRDEAGVWDRQSGELKEVAGKVAELRIDRFEAGIFQVFVTSYSAAIREVIGRCGEGSQRTAEIAKSLRQVAAAYDKAEGDGEQLIKEVF